jgi:hypothetical protein
MYAATALAGMVSRDPSDWMRDPFGTFSALKGYFFGALDNFEKRRRLLPVLEAQNVAIGRYAVSLPLTQQAARDQLADVYSSELSKLEALRAQGNYVANKVHQAIATIQDLRSKLRSLPGGQFLDPIPPGTAGVDEEAGLGAIDPASMAIAAAVVIAASVAAIAWAHSCDERARVQKKYLDMINALPIPPGKKAEYMQDAVTHGGNPDPSAFVRNLGIGLSTGVLAIIAAVLILPMLMKRGS